MKLFLFTLLFTLAAHAIAVDSGVTYSYAYSQGTAAIPIAANTDYGVMDIITVLPSSASGDFTANSSDHTLNKTANGYGLGLQVKVSSDTTLAAPLAANTTYYVVPGATTGKFYLATSLANSIASPAVTILISTDGTGNQHVVPLALSGASVKLQGSMANSSDWTDLPIVSTGDATKSGTVTTDVNIYLKDWSTTYNYVREYVTLTAGQLNMTSRSKVKGLKSP